MTDTTDIAKRAGVPVPQKVAVIPPKGTVGFSTRVTPAQMTKIRAWRTSVRDNPQPGVTLHNLNNCPHCGQPWPDPD